jgi:hypothetical protein
MSFQPQKEGGCDNNENECLTKGVAEEQPSGRSSLTPPEDKHQPLQNRHSIVSNVARKASSFTGLMSAPRVKRFLAFVFSIFLQETYFYKFFDE